MLDVLQRDVDGCGISPVLCVDVIGALGLPFHGLLLLWSHSAEIHSHTYRTYRDTYYNMCTYRGHIYDCTCE